MAEVTVVEGIFDDAELETVLAMRDAWAYAPAGARLPRRFRRPGVRPTPLQTPSLRFASELPPRVDTSRHRRRLVAHARTSGGREPRPGSLSYLRALYATGGRFGAVGVERILDSEHLAEVARRHFAITVVRPTIVYANLYLPGQLLDPHTDIPAFRGADLSTVPPWLLVAMHHSGRFDRWRIGVATVVCYPTACSGGAFSYYPTGVEPIGVEGSAPSGRVTVEVTANSALVLDADTVFHGVDEVAGEPIGLEELHRGAYLAPAGGDRWDLCLDDSLDDPSPRTIRLASFAPGQIRYSLSWKAYCFVDARAERRWADHEDDLSVDRIIPTLCDELRRREVIHGPVDHLSEAELAAVFIDELIPFPAPSR